MVQVIQGSGSKQDQVRDQRADPGAKPLKLDVYQLMKAASLWRRNWCSDHIAAQLAVPEAAVYNSLEAVKQAAWRLEQRQALR